MNLNDYRDLCYQLATEKGWHETERTFGEYIALMHSELSEALEEHRNGRAVDEVYFLTSGKPEGVPIELADELIRIFDFCGRYDINIESAVLLKLEYNGTRQHRHGGKVI